MSYRVSICAESPEELQEKIEALLSKGIFAKNFTPKEYTQEVDADDDGMEEVASPYANSKPSLNTVIDNEVDAEGIPWDKRIHSSKKTKVKDGTWKIARGVDSATVFTVKNELRGRVGTSFVTETAPVQQQPSIPAQAPAQQATTPTLPTTPPLPQMQTGHTLASFKANFAQTVASLITQGKLTQEYVNSLKAHFGNVEVWQFNDAQIEGCFNEFVNCGIVQKVA